VEITADRCEGVELDGSQCRSQCCGGETGVTLCLESKYGCLDSCQLLYWLTYPDFY